MHTGALQGYEASVNLPDARIISDELSNEQFAAKSDQLGYLNCRLAQNRKDAVFRILFTQTKELVDLRLDGNGMSACLSAHTESLANGILTQAIKLLIDPLQTATLVQTEQYDRIAAIFAVQFIDTCRTQKPVGLSQIEVHGKRELKHFIARRHPATGEYLIAERLIEISRPDNLASDKAFFLKQPVEALRQRA